jgi:hypothetical protein
MRHATRQRRATRYPTLGILVDKDKVINYQLVIIYRLLIRILTNQSTVDKPIVLSTNC